MKNPQNCFVQEEWPHAGECQGIKRKLFKKPNEEAERIA
jgi:hypothetical protein